MPSESHILFEGDLSDAPGRAESWTESVRYLGRGAWELLSKGTGFSGGERNVVFRERLSTRGMVDWVRARDVEDTDVATTCTVNEAADDESEGSGVLLGPRTARLLEIAEIVGAGHCCRCLRGLAAGTWPPEPKAPVIQQVTGVALRSVWIRVSHPVFTVLTSGGPAFLYPPSRDGRAQLVLTSSSSTDRGLTIQLSKKWLFALEPWKDDLAQLAKAKSGGSRPNTE